MPCFHYLMYFPMGNNYHYIEFLIPLNLECGLLCNCFKKNPVFLQTIKNMSHWFTYSDRGFEMQCIVYIVNSTNSATNSSHTAAVYLDIW